MSPQKKHASRTGFRRELRRRLSIWVTQHLQALVFSLGQYLRHPIGNILTTAVVGISLALPAGFYLLLENARRISSGWDGAVEFTLFLRQDVRGKDTGELAETLKQDRRIAAVIIVPRDEALAEYKNISGFADAIDALEENPLPDVLLIKLDDELDAEQQEQLFHKLSALRQTDSLQYDRQWVQRLFILLDIIRWSVWILFVLLATAVLLIVGNTIRLSIYNQKPEIEITKLFGASNAFIQRPFLYSGLWYGVFGAIIAWLLLRLSLQLLKSPVDRLASLYNSQFELSPPGFSHFTILLIVGVILGLGGSWLSVRRHIHAIEPA